MVLAPFLLQITAMVFSRKTGWLLLIPLVAALQCKKSNNTNNVEPPGAVEIKDSAIVTNLNFPWEILWGPDNYIWMTERGGKISRVNPTTGVVTPLLTISEVVSNNEGGLLGMVLHPNFSATPQVFVVYDYNNAGNYREKVVRYIYNGTTLTGPLTLIDNIAASSIHNGSRLVITPDLKLFISTGDASNQSLPQNTSALNGKILRINLDGTIPADNPVPGNPYWSLGHRNPQGLVFANNKLYSSEHGPDNDDEINIIEKGRNYGWPNVEGYCDSPGEQSFCSSYNVKEPVRNWTPTAAVSGLDYYTGDLIPQWKNSLLVVALKNARLYQMKLDDTFMSITQTNEYFTNVYGRMRDICISPDGKVYICTSNGGNSDKIIEVSKK
ncbi:MAG: PQQ-dependent sugar dehydrogenase [Bacteroidota bacterium]|nr:PQQ-dependent sugar dehydrogenase [Bacteroidota bacterium]